MLHGQIDSESAIRNFAAQLAAVQHRAGRRRPRPAPASSTPAASRPSSCATSSSTTGSSWASCSTTWSRPATSSSSTSTASSRCWCSTPTSSRAASPWSRSRPDTGLYDAHFGMIITDTGRARGLRGHRHPAAPRTGQPADERQRPLHRAGRPRATPAAPSTHRARAGAATTLRSWRPTTRRPGKLDLGRPGRDGAAGFRPTGTVAPPTLGEESWKWLFLQPLTTGQE